VVGGGLLPHWALMSNSFIRTRRDIPTIASRLQPTERVSVDRVGDECRWREGVRERVPRKEAGTIPSLFATFFTEHSGCD